MEREAMTQRLICIETTRLPDVCQTNVPQWLAVPQAPQEGGTCPQWLDGYTWSGRYTVVDSAEWTHTCANSSGVPLT
jgi:hypothetical protein